MPPTAFKDSFRSSGVKYTTARAVAERTVDLVLKKLRRPPVACRTADVTLPDGGVSDTAAGIRSARHPMRKWRRRWPTS